MDSIGSEVEVSGESLRNVEDTSSISLTSITVHGHCNARLTIILSRGVNTVSEILTDTGRTIDYGSIFSDLQCERDILWSTVTNKELRSAHNLFCHTVKLMRVVCLCWSSSDNATDLITVLDKELDLVILWAEDSKHTCFKSYVTKHTGYRLLYQEYVCSQSLTSLGSGTSNLRFSCSLYVTDPSLWSIDHQETKYVTLDVDECMLIKCLSLRRVWAGSTIHEIEVMAVQSAFYSRWNLCDNGSLALMREHKIQQAMAQRCMKASLIQEIKRCSRGKKIFIVGNMGHLTREDLRTFMKAHLPSFIEGLDDKGIEFDPTYGLTIARSVGDKSLNPDYSGWMHHVLYRGEGNYDTYQSVDAPSLTNTEGLATYAIINTECPPPRPTCPPPSSTPIRGRGPSRSNA